MKKIIALCFLTVFTVVSSLAQNDGPIYDLCITSSIGTGVSVVTGMTPNSKTTAALPIVSSLKLNRIYLGADYATNSLWSGSDDKYNYAVAKLGYNFKQNKDNVKGHYDTSIYLCLGSSNYISKNYNSGGIVAGLGFAIEFCKHLSAFGTFMVHDDGMIISAGLTYNLHFLGF